MDTRDADDQALMGRLEALTDIPGQLSSPYIRAAAEDALAALASERARRKSLEGALKPFADAVYDDNGDVTITPCGISDYVRARKALEDQE